MNTKETFTRKSNRGLFWSSAVMLVENKEYQIQQKTQSRKSQTQNIHKKLKPILTNRL